MKPTVTKLPITFKPTHSQKIIIRPHRRKLAGWWLRQGTKKPSIICFVCFVYFVVSVTASTITGNIQNTSGAAYATNALFAPLSTPLVSGSNIIASTPTNVVAAANGSFSVSLKQGNYLVTIGNLRRDSVLIAVPNDANTYNLNSLITNALTFNFPYSPIYEQQVNKGQADGYVGLIGTVLNPAGLTASNFNFRGTVNFGTDSANPATVYLNQNSSVSVAAGASISLAGDSSPRAEMFLHGTNAFLRFDEDAGINDSVASQVWKFNKFSITSNQVARFGDVTNMVSALAVGVVPVGAIVAWHKSYTHTPALPAQFVECNGQTLSDSASVYNGQVLPN